MLLQDFRYALRAFAKRPQYALVTILVLAVAIGANTTVFSIFNGLLLRPLPYPDENRLVAIYNTYPKMGLDMAGTSIPDYLDRRERAPTLENLAIYNTALQTLSGDGPPEQIQLTRASPSLFSVLGVMPVLGRGFAAEDAVPGNEQVVILSHRLWNTRFGARADVLGSDLQLDGRPFRVIGVMPERFGFPDTNMDAWMPFAFTPEQISDAERGTEFSFSIGRLRPGATIEGLNAEMDAIVRANLELGRLQSTAFIETTGFTGRARLLRDMAVGNLEQMLWILQGIVLGVLLIACANVANLQLARMAARRKELAVRAALGADRRRLARLVMVESLVLAVVGGALGLALASGGLELVRALGLDRANEGFEFVLDARVLGFTAGAALVAALVSGLLPLIGLVREDLARAVNEAGRLGGGGRAAHGFRSGLVVVQIGVSVALLVGAGLLTKNFYHLQQEGAGFDSESVWTARVVLPQTRYRDEAAMARFFERALEGLSALPGVIDAGYTSTLPFSGNNSQGSYVVDGYTPPEGVAPPHAQQRSISEGYLPSLDIPVIRGRNFTATETELVAIVDENLANKYWPDGDALGQRVRNDFADPQGGWHSVVGIVPAIKQGSLAEDPVKETVYWHYKQRPRPGGVFTLRTLLPPEQLTRAAGDAVLRIDPGIALFNVMSMDARVRQSLGSQRAPMVLTFVFAAVAFVLSIVGIYGVLTWAVTQRSGEIGVRLALGAQGRDVVKMILRQGARLIVVGLAFGVAGAVGLGSLLASQLRDINAVDPTVFAIAITGLAAAALFASWLPARRASRVDPMLALRQE
jgi:predicted permease